MALITLKEFREFMLSEDSHDAQKEYNGLPPIDLADPSTRDFIQRFYNTLEREGIAPKDGTELCALVEIMMSGAWLGAALVEKKLMREEVVR